MALSMDEQRVLAEIERRLAAEDPGLAACLTTFRRPGPVTVLRSPRARIIGSLFTVLLVAMVSLMVYAMIPFRGHTTSKAPDISPSHATTAQANGTSAESITAGPGAVTGSAKPAASRAGQAATGKAGGGPTSTTDSRPLPGADNDSRHNWMR